MAIVKMKRVGLVGAADLRDTVLSALQDVALLHPVPLSELPDDPPADLVSRQLAAQRVTRALEIRRKQLGKKAPELLQGNAAEVGERTVARVEELLAQRNEAESRLSMLVKERSRIFPWGDFNPEDILLFEERKVYLRLFALERNRLGETDLSAASWVGEFPLDPKGKRVGLAVLSLDAPLDLPWDPVSLPSRSLGRIEEEIRTTEKEIASIEDELAVLSAELPAVKKYEMRILDRLRYTEVVAGAEADEDLFALSGWCPAARVPRLREAVAGLSVAAVIEDPDEDDDVPIALENGPLVRQFEPLLKAFNLPHYRESDPTLFIAPFMGIFFGFCLGDLGYGVVLTGVSAWALSRFKPEGEFRLALEALGILGLCTVVIGGLTGNFFGLHLYDLFDWPESSALFMLSADPAKFFYVSLAFGVVQLTVGMLIRLVRNIQFADWEGVVGSLGWLSVFPAIAVWVLVGTPWVFVGSLLLILFFASPSPSLVRRIGGGAWALYNITGLVGDVMSYARIFGLGLSSGIIAMVVNTIAATVAGSVPGVGWILAGVVLLCGHGFNFLMAIIGAVVHPARLQFLEFFGKFFEGGGRPYAPFRKLEGE